MSKIGKKNINVPKESSVKIEKGVMSDVEARKQNVGGEIICRVF